MTRIVLLLTAIPLAAVLALILNTLLDRRLAALEAPTEHSHKPVAPRGLSIALALALCAAAVPALAKDRGPACDSIECSLLVEAARVDELWRSTSGDRVALVAQSRIPVAFDPDLDRWDADPEGEVATDRSPQPEPSAEPPVRSP